MPIVNADAARWSNANMSAQAFEAQTTDPYRSGKEVTLTKGQNATMAAATFEGRASQEQGTH